MEDKEARDARLLTEQERQGLCKMLFNALLEIRMLGREGKAEQAAAEEALEELPILKEKTFLRRFITGQVAPILLASPLEDLE